MNNKWVVSCFTLMLGLSSFGGVALANDQNNNTSPNVYLSHEEKLIPGTVIVYGPPEGGH